MEVIGILTITKEAIDSKERPYYSCKVGETTFNLNSNYDEKWYNFATANKGKNVKVVVEKDGKFNRVQDMKLSDAAPQGKRSPKDDVIITRLALAKSEIEAGHTYDDGVEDADKWFEWVMKVTLVDAAKAMGAVEIKSDEEMDKVKTWRLEKGLNAEDLPRMVGATNITELKKWFADGYTADDFIKAAENNLAAQQEMSL